jgi:NitT/TauT family transport system ATP-binding protein
MATVIHTEDLAVSFDGVTPVFEGLNLAIEKGEFVTLVGVSGAGKSTLLRVIADLIPAFRGTVEVDTPTDPARRSIAMVFQAANLMPWRRVRDNITLGLEGIDVSESVKQERVRSTLELLGLPDYADRWPYQLSGGQRQRIGIARGLAVDPDILLMDEPFGALDAITRTALQDELLRIWKETGKSILFVTHDIEEAVYLGDRVLLLGGVPARIFNEYEITLDREERRESEAFLREVDKVRNGLKAAIQSALDQGET